MSMRRVLMAGLATGALVGLNAATADAVVVPAGGHQVGVAMVPGTLSSTALTTAGFPPATGSALCADPQLASTPDLGQYLPMSSLCWQGGSVLHQNETFTLTWDPIRSFFETTRTYLQTFLSNVAADSGKGTSPYAVTSQYADSSGRALNSSAFGGGCIDYGNPGGYTCQFGDVTGSGTGLNYTDNGGDGCSQGALSGTNQFNEELDGSWDSQPNSVCITDAQIQDELKALVPNSHMLDHTKAGYLPIVDVLTPPGVEVCLDQAGTFCSANGASSLQFCSYHSDVQMPSGGPVVAYTVVPWTVSWQTQTGCKEPDSPTIPPHPAAQVLADDSGAQLVSPLSEAEIASIVDPTLNGWYAQNGDEINDNGCMPFENQLDQVSVNGTSYFLQREFNNAGMIKTDPDALKCTPTVALQSAFVAPSVVNPGDVVELDGSGTVSTLLVPKEGYDWNFGDGAQAVGPSVVHSYAAPGTYTVTLTVTDRGGNTSTLSHQIIVAGQTGQTGQTGPLGTQTGDGGQKNKKPKKKSGFRAQVQLLPQGLADVLHKGISTRVTSNETASGIVTLMISGRDARRAHIASSHRPSVIVGRGTVSTIKAGTVNLHLRLSHGVIAKLKHLSHLTLTVRIALVTHAGQHLTIDAAGRY